MEKYIAPTFWDDSPPPLSAENINAMAKAAEAGQVINFGARTITTDMWFDNDAASYYRYAACIGNAAFTNPDDLPIVIFGRSRAIEGNLAPYVTLEGGAIIIYAHELPKTSVRILNILLIQTVQP